MNGGELAQRAERLRDERDGHFAEAHRLLDRAEAAGRDLTTLELGRWREVLQRAEELESELGDILDQRIRAESAERLVAPFTPEGRAKTWKNDTFRRP